MNNRLLSAIFLVALIPLANAEPGPELEVVQASEGKILCNVKGEIKAVDSVKSCNKAKHSKLRNLLDEQKLGIKIKIIDVDIAEALSIGLKYKYIVRPNKSDEYYTRIDKWILDTGLTPGDLLDDVPVFLKMKAESELIFAQQFTNGVKARKPNNGYSPRMIPVTAKKALKLKTGDFVLFNTQMNLSAGLEQVFPLAGDMFEAKAGLSFLVGGDYQVQINRLDAKKVRVKLIGIRTNKKAFKTKLGSGQALEIFGVRAQDKKIVKIADLNKYFSLELSKSKDDLFVLDYTLDLSDKKVAEAYDDVFNSIKKFRSYKLASHLLDKMDINKRLISNVLALEELSKEQLIISDKNLRTVVRNMKASNTSKATQEKFKFGLITFRSESNEVFRDNFLTSIKNDVSEEKEYFVYPSWSKKHSMDRGLIGRVFGFGESLDEDVLQTSNAVFKSDKDGNPTEFINIGFLFDYEDRVMTKKEMSKIASKLMTLIPTAAKKNQFERDLINNGWAKGKTNRVRISLDYFFHKGALEALMAPKFGDGNGLLSDKEIMKYEFLSYIDELGIYEADYLANKSKFKGPRYSGHDGKLRILYKLIERRARILIGHLSNAFSSGQDKLERYDNFATLRKSSMFRQLGTGFLVNLLSRVVSNDEMKELMYMDAKFSSANKETVEVQFGSNPERELYEIVRFIEFVLNNDTVHADEWVKIQEMIQKTVLVYAQ